MCFKPVKSAETESGGTTEPPFSKLSFMLWTIGQFLPQIKTHSHCSSGKFIGVVLLCAYLNGRSIAG